MSAARPVGPETVAGAVVPNKSSQRRVASVGMPRQRPTGTGKAAGPSTRPGMSWSARLAILVPRMAIMSSSTFSWRSNFLADICSMVKTVHHRNGVRNENRPENLELWTTPQPSGIRVSDAIAWAHTVLERYESVGAPPTVLTHLRQNSWRWRDSNPRPSASQ